MKYGQLKKEVGKVGVGAGETSSDEMWVIVIG